MTERGLLTAAIVLLAIHSVPPGIQGEDLNAAMLRDLPPIRLSFGADGWIRSEQVTAAEPIVRQKLQTAGIPLVPDQDWPPADDYGLVLEVGGRVNESGDGCVLVVTTNLTEYGRPIRKVTGIDTSKLARVTSWHGTRLIGHSQSQAGCWNLFLQSAEMGVDKFIADYKAANASDSPPLVE